MKYVIKNLSGKKACVQHQLTSCRVYISPHLPSIYDSTFSTNLMCVCAEENTVAISNLLGTRKAAFSSILPGNGNSETTISSLNLNPQIFLAT